jgi:5-methylcytosine-specific restriction endonuclease McrA
MVIGESSIEFPVGVSAADGLAKMVGEKTSAVAKAIAELTGRMGCLILISGSPEQGVHVKPNWRPTAKWSAAWRSFQRTLYGEGWKCPVRVRRRVLARDGGQCRYCGLDAARCLTLDHVQPRALGGADTVENLVVACRECNLRKGKRTPEQAGMTLRLLGGE